MKRVAATGKPPAVIPLVIVPVDVHVAVIVPAVEGDNVHLPSRTLPLECS